MKIVVGYSVTAEGAAALDRAIEEARLRDAELHLVRVLPGLIAENPRRAREQEEQQRVSRKELGEVEQRLEDEGVRAVVSVLDSETAESPSGAMLDYVRDAAADLLVIGLRHRSPVGKLVLGSTAQDLLLGAPCPVLAVKAPQAG